MMATQSQALVSSALQELKLVPVESGMTGGDQTLKVTDETVAFVKGLSGKSVVVDGDGIVTIA